MMTGMVSRVPFQANIEEQVKERVQASIRTQLGDLEFAKVEFAVGFIVDLIAERQMRLGNHLDVDELHQKAMGILVRWLKLLVRSSDARKSLDMTSAAC